MSMWIQWGKQHDIFIKVACNIWGQYDTHVWFPGLESATTTGSKSCEKWLGRDKNKTLLALFVGMHVGQIQIP